MYVYSTLHVYTHTHHPTTDTYTHTYHLLVDLLHFNGHFLDEPRFFLGFLSQVVPEENLGLSVTSL